MNEDRIAGTAKDFAGKTENAFGKAAGDAESQASGRAREMAGKAQNLYGQAKDAVQDAADTATDYAKDMYNHRGDAIREGQDALIKKVHDNPIGSLVTAGAIGFALALLLARGPPAGNRVGVFIREGTFALEIRSVNDDIPLSPPMYEDPDAVLYRKPRTTDAIDALKSAIGRVQTAIDAGRQPGMPLSVLSNVAKEAPLGSLAIAFLIGVAIGRRSR